MYSISLLKTFIAVHGVPKITKTSEISAKSKGKKISIFFLKTCLRKNAAIYTGENN